MTSFRFAILAAALIATGSAYAGGLADPIIEPTIIEAGTVSSSHDVLVPILALLLLGAAVSTAE